MYMWLYGIMVKASSIWNKNNDNDDDGGKEDLFSNMYNSAIDNSKITHFNCVLVPKVTPNSHISCFTSSISKHNENIIFIIWYMKQ